MIQPTKTVGATEIDRMICQNSPAVKFTQSTPTRKAITSDVKQAVTKIAATISAGNERSALPCFSQNSSRATIQ